MHLERERAKINSTLSDHAARKHMAGGLTDRGTFVGVVLLYLDSSLPLALT